MSEQARTLCNRDCPDACAIIATVEDGRVVKLAGDPDHPVTRGFLCYRTNHFLSTQYAPDRLLAPLYRERSDAPFREIGWDEALALAARRLVAIREESGPEAIFHYRSAGSMGLVNVVTDLFFELFGPTTSKRGDICHAAGDFAQLTDFGEEDSHDLHDLRNSRHILLWGKNVFVSSPHTIPVLNDARARGAELVLVDPVHHRTASLCQAFVQPRPGGDLALALAVARVLFEGGWARTDGCDHVDGFRALAYARSVADHCADADVAPAVAADLARRLHEGPTAILVGWGMCRRANGASIVRALDALCALSGNLGVPGGGVAYYVNQRRAFDGHVLATGRPAPRTICEPLFGQEVLAATDPPIRAIWVTAANPAAMLPEAETVARALATRDFVVVADSFLTDTARLAHLVLPTPTLLEADDLLGAYGHHYLGVARPVVPPPPGVRSDLEIVQGLAAHVGLSEALAGDSRAWQRKLTAGKLAARGLTLEDLETGPVKSPVAPDVLFEGGLVATATGRVNLMTALPPPLDEEPFGPLYLMSLSTDKAQASQWAKPQDGLAVVTVHPDSAAGIPDGGTGRLISPIGALTVTVKHDAKQRKDVALIPKGGHLHAGRCANVLIRARTTDGGEGAALYDERVRLTAL